MFDNRARPLRADRKVITFSAFVSAMDERFKADKEGDANYEKLWKVKYSSNVLDYIEKLEALNLRVGVLAEDH